jgi:ABC-type nickel/cobalt efflux system permease component RcnA
MDLYYEIYSLLVGFQKTLQADLSNHVRLIAASGTIAPSIAVLAIALGTVHAMTPGHGKAVVVSYFIGRDAHPFQGFSMAARVALSHTVSAVVLVLLFGAGVSVLGRPSGAASALQTVSFGLIAAMGAYYLVRALRPLAHVEPHKHRESVLPYAVGVLPCPLTMLVVGHAMVLGAYLTGLVLAALMGAGAALTIGLFGTLGIVFRRGLFGAIDPDGRRLTALITAFEIGSSLVILALGLAFFIGSLS